MAKEQEMTIYKLKRRSLSTKIGQDHVEHCDNVKYLKKIPKNFFHLIVTSPPYNLNKEYEKKQKIKDYIRDQEKIIQECIRVLHPKGSICWQVGNYIKKGEIIPLDMPIYDLFKKRGLKLRNRIIWHFEHGLHASKRLSGRYETILWFTKKDDYIFNLDKVRVPQKWPNKRHYQGPKKGQISSNPKGKNPSDYWNESTLDIWKKPNDPQIWDIPNVKSMHPEKTTHPCQFPIGLIDPLVQALTRKGQNVLDPYMGVGSTIIAAIKNQRNGYGCDIQKPYVQQARERIRQFKKGKLKIRENEKGKHPGPKKLGMSA